MSGAAAGVWAWEEDEVLPHNGPSSGNLADILERVLDKGIVIAGDIKIDLLDIELLTIRVRLFVSSVDTARKAGIDWWETDPALSSRAKRDALMEENAFLRGRLRELEPGDDEEEDGAERTTESRGRSRSGRNGPPIERTAPA